MPGDDVVNYVDKVIRGDADFFVPPPPEIGHVLKADSALGRNDNPLSDAAYKKRGRMIMGVIFLIIVALNATWALLVPLWNNSFRSRYFIGFTIMTVVCTAMEVLYVSIKRGTKRKMMVFSCSFVGQDGAAIYTLEGGIGDGVTADVLLFAQTADVLMSDTDISNSGPFPCPGIAYKYNWRNAEGETLLHCEGAYNGADKKFTPQHPIYFFWATEEQWCDYQFEKMKEEFEAKGYVEFAIGPKRAVRVSTDYIEFNWPDGDYRTPVEDLREISLSRGEFRFAHGDAKWMGNKGKFIFKYAEISNAKLFLTITNQLGGVSWPDEE